MDCPWFFREATKFLALVTWTVFALHWVRKPFVHFHIIRVSEARQMKFNEAAGAFRSMEGKVIKEEKILEIV
jgi:exosortase/archaeosortase